MRKVAGMWTEEYGEVLILSAKKGPVEKIIKKLREPLVCQGLVVREINGWKVASYQFASIFKSDIISPTGIVAGSHTSGVKREVEAFVHSYLKAKGIL